MLQDYNLNKVDLPKLAMPPNTRIVVGINTSGDKQKSCFTNSLILNSGTTCSSIKVVVDQRSHLSIQIKLGGFWWHYPGMMMYAHHRYSYLSSPDNPRNNHMYTTFPAFVRWRAMKLSSYELLPWTAGITNIRHNESSEMFSRGEILI